MKYTKETFMTELVDWVKSECSNRRYGTFGFEITMHDGMPVSITETNRRNFNRVVGGIESK